MQNSYKTNFCLHFEFFRQLSFRFKQKISHEPFAARKSINAARLARLICLMHIFAAVFFAFLQFSFILMFAENFVDYYRDSVDCLGNI